MLLLRRLGLLRLVNMMELMRGRVDGLLLLWMLRVLRLAMTMRDGMLLSMRKRVVVRVSGHRSSRLRRQAHHHGHRHPSLSLIHRHPLGLLL